MPQKKQVAKNSQKTVPLLQGRVLKPMGGKGLSGYLRKQSPAKPVRPRKLNGGGQAVKGLENWTKSPTKKQKGKIPY